MRAPTGPEAHELLFTCRDAIADKSGLCPESAHPFLPTAWQRHFEDRALLFHVYEELFTYQPRILVGDRFPVHDVLEVIENVTTSLYEWIESPEDLYYPPRSYGRSWEEQPPGCRADFDNEWIVLTELHSDSFPIKDECIAMRGDWGGDLGSFGLWPIYLQLPELKRLILRHGSDLTALEALECELDFSNDFAAKWQSLMPELKNLADELREHQMLAAATHNHRGDLPRAQRVRDLVHPFGYLNRLEKLKTGPGDAAWDLTKLAYQMDSSYRRGPIAREYVWDFEKGIIDDCRQLLFIARGLDPNDKEFIEALVAELVAGTLTLDGWEQRKQRLIQIDVSRFSSPVGADVEHTNASNPRELQTTQVGDETFNVDDETWVFKVREDYAEIKRLASHLDRSEPIEDRTELHSLKTKIRQWFHGGKNRRRKPKSYWSSLEQNEMDVVVRIMRMFSKKHKKQ